VIWSRRNFVAGKAVSRLVTAETPKRNNIVFWQIQVELYKQLKLEIRVWWEGKANAVTVRLAKK